MAKVSFKTKSGKKVEFNTSPGRKRKRKASSYNRFVAKYIEGCKKGTSKSAMKGAAKAWKDKKK